MNKLDDILPVLRKHGPALKQPGILALRPGYKMRNGWPTTEKAIVAIKAQSAASVNLPAAVEGIPVEVRDATNIEEMRYRHPDRYEKIAAQRAEVRGGAFEEIDPVLAPPAPAAPASVAVAAPGVAAAPAPGVLAAKPQIPYTGANKPLAPVTGALTFTCHASPDAGWPTLEKFLEGVQSTLTIGLYDFTSKHILNQVASSLAGNKTMRITLDNPALNPTADQSDSETVAALEQDLGSDFKSAWALVRANKAIRDWIYPTAYHIKVAVRDSSVVWLSSGNWNNSNQPDFDPINQPGQDDQTIARKSDRDWHVIIENAQLADTFEQFLLHDFQVAASVAQGAAPLAMEAEAPVPEAFRQPAKGTFAFEPPFSVVGENATITPLLTPDPGIYQQSLLQKIQSAQSKLYIQLQYIHPSDSATDSAFEDLIDAVAAKLQTPNFDLRIIVSNYQTSNGWLERLQAAGIDLSVVKIQSGVHNKGFVIDSKVVILGSQNWSGDGVLRNRDASVIIEHAGAAKYFEKLFLHDWDRIARQSVN